LKALQKVLKCNSKEMRKLGKKMSETVMVGSMEIWRQNAHEIQPGTRDDANALIREEIDQLEHARVEEEGNAEIEAGIENEDDLMNQDQDEDDDEEIELFEVEDDRREMRGPEMGSERENEILNAEAQIGSIQVHEEAEAETEAGADEGEGTVEELADDEMNTDSESWFQ
jgi:hypothetical protein